MILEQESGVNALSYGWMMKKETVAVALVTYNRFPHLQNLLQSLKNSEFPIESIHIVDNNSTDETIWNLPKMAAVDPTLNVVRLPENRGGAGGFNVAIEKAYQSGADWVWVMDDDVMVRPDGLSKLLSYQDQGLCIHGVRLQPNGEVLPFEQWMNLKTGFTKILREKSFRQGRKFCRLNVGCFEGMLIHRSIIAQIGLPDPQFFLTEDDAFYGFLASQFTNVLYVDETVMDRQLSRPRHVFFLYRHYLSAPEHHLYYFIRNKFLMYRKLRRLGHANSFLFALRLARYVIRVSLLYGVYEFDVTKLHSIIQAVQHGLQGRFGPRFSLSPEVTKAHLVVSSPRRLQSVAQRPLSSGK